MKKPRKYGGDATVSDEVLDDIIEKSYVTIAPKRPAPGDIIPSSTINDISSTNRPTRSIVTQRTGRVPDVTVEKIPGVFTRSSQRISCIPQSKLMEGNSPSVSVTPLGPRSSNLRSSNANRILISSNTKPSATVEKIVMVAKEKRPVVIFAPPMAHNVPIILDQKTADIFRPLCDERVVSGTNTETKMLNLPERTAKTYNEY